MPFQTARVIGMKETNMTSIQQQNIQALLAFVQDSNDVKVQFAVPEMATPLMPHQVTGTQFALERQRVLIADEMGVGKTPTGIAIATASVNAGLRPVLCVVPPSMRLQWKREFERFAPQITTTTLTGTNNPKAKDKSKYVTELPDVDVIIIGDSSLDGFKNLLIGKIGGIVIDECQRVKGGKRAKRSKACIEIAQSVPFGGLRVAMSGTPLINRPMELLPVIEMLDRANTFKGGIYGYMNRYAPKVDQYGSRGASNLQELNKVLTDTFMIRRKRADVLTLPNKGRIQMHIALDAKREKQYRFAEDNLYEWIKSTRGEQKADNAMRAEALVRINELRQISAMGKTSAVIEYVNDLLEQDEQVFITCAFAREADTYFEAFEKQNVVRVIGGMTDVQKMSAVDAFQSGEARVLVGNIIASGTGLTLTSGRHHISASLPWTSADLLQCEDRLSRHGQSREVVSHIMLADLDDIVSIDQRMIALLEMKNDVLTSVLDGKDTDLLDDDTASTAMLVLKGYGW